MKRVLFIVRTPLQLFNAIEARERFHQDDYCVLLVYYKKQVDLEIMRSLYDGNWVACEEFLFRGLSQLLYPFALHRLSALNAVYDQIYAGLISNIPLHLFNCFPSAERWLLDDGNEILKLSRVIRDHGYKPRKFFGFYDWFMGRRLDVSVLDNVCFFTSYPLATDFPGRVVKNDYRCFRSRASQLETRELELFIGSNLVPQYLTQETYLALLRQIKRNTAKKLFYCPHRYEPETLLEQIEKLGFQLMRFPTILEYAFYQQGWVPTHVSTIRSTAVDTLHQLYQLPRTIYRLPLSVLKTEGHRQEYINLYHYYDSKDVSLVDLRDDNNARGK